MEILNDNNFEENIKEGKILVDFYADWCGPCKMISPILEEISQEKAEVKIVKVDVDSSPNISMKYGIRSIPTLILFENGQIVDKKLGALSKAQLVNWLQ